MERVEASENLRLVIHADRKPSAEHSRKCNAPTTNEVGLLMVGNDSEKGDIILEKQIGRLRKVAETNRAYDALQYSLIFWKGADRYHFLLRQSDPATRQTTNRKASAQAFYSFRLMTRNQNFNHLHTFKQLLNQFVPDTFAKIDSKKTFINQTYSRETEG